jgi:hypothetical protein
LNTRDSRAKRGEQGPCRRLTIVAAFHVPWRVAWRCAVIALAGLVLLGTFFPREDAPRPDEE